MYRKLFLALAFFSFPSPALFAQSGFSCSMGDSSGVSVALESRLEPAVPPLPGSYQMGCRIPKKTKTGTIAFSRDAENSSTHEFFGYTMEVAPVTDKPGTYRVVFGRLSETAEDLGLKDPAIWAMLPAPSFPAPQIVTVSDSLLFDVFVNPATGQKIVDYIHIRQDACDPRTASDLPCLKRSLEDARHALNEKVKLFENSPDTAKAVSARSSQQTWEKYLTDACSPLDSEFKRLRCELKLVQSRTQDLATIY